MVKISDFKVGQTVYMEVIGNAKRHREKEDLIIESKVEKVGRKYVTVGRIKFEDTDGRSFDGLVESSEYSPNYILYPSKEVIDEVFYRRRLFSSVNSLLCGKKIEQLSTEQLEEILKIISVEERITDGR